MSEQELEEAADRARLEAEAKASAAAEAKAKHALVAREAAAVVRRMNERHFVVQVGGKTRVATLLEGEMQPLGFGTREDIFSRYANDFVPAGVGKDGRVLKKTAAEVWWVHPDRRWYDRVALEPNAEPNPRVYNLWKGFAIEPKPGPWATTERFLREVVCDGNREHYEWLVRWMARCVQVPEEPAGVAVVLRGEKGTGKTTFANLFLSFFGHHNSLSISNYQHLTGNFNSHLLGKVALALNEAFWAGDKRGEGVLKTLVTDGTVFIEPKGIDGFQAPNRLKIVMTTNNEWAVPTTMDERRFLVLTVSKAQATRSAYFAELAAALDGGERAALLDYLLNLDLQGFDHRNPPHTADLNAQKVHSFETLDLFLEGWLAEADFDEGKLVDKDDFYKEYEAFARSRGRYAQVLTKSSFYKDMKKRLGCVRYDVRPPRLGRRVYLELAGPAELRACFAEYHRIPAEELWNLEEGE